MKTPAENAGPQSISAGKEHGNIHHNITQSRGGSNEECNLSEVLVSRHNDFHRSWGSNRLPTDLVRLLGIHSLGMEHPEQQVTPDQLSYLCRSTRTPDLRNIYRMHAVRPVSDPVGALLSLQAMENARTHIIEEIAWTRQTIDALRLEEVPYPAQYHSLTAGAMTFFDVDSPAKAAEGILTERSFGTLSWSRPLLANVRESLLNVLKGKHIHRGKQSKEHLPVLQQHLSAITRMERDFATTKERLIAELYRSFNGLHVEADTGR